MLLTMHARSVLQLCSQEQEWYGFVYVLMVHKVLRINETGLIEYTCLNSNASDSGFYGLPLSLLADTMILPQIRP